MSNLLDPSISSNIEKSRSNKVTGVSGKKEARAYPTREPPNSSDSSIGFPLVDDKSSPRIPSKAEESNQKKPRLFPKSRGTTGSKLKNTRIMKSEGLKFKCPKDTKDI